MRSYLWSHLEGGGLHSIARTSDRLRLPAPVPESEQGVRCAVCPGKCDLNYQVVVVSDVRGGELYLHLLVSHFVPLKWVGVSESARVCGLGECVPFK